MQESSGKLTAVVLSCRLALAAHGRCLEQTAMEHVGVVFLKCQVLRNHLGVMLKCRF